MMLNKGTYGNERILSRPSVELMTTDQITAGAEGGLTVLPRILGQPRLGVRRVDRHPPRRPGNPWPVRLVRRLRHVRGVRSEGGHDRHPDDAARRDSPSSPEVLRISGLRPTRRSTTEDTSHHRLRRSAGTAGRYSAGARARRRPRAARAAGSSAPCPWRCAAARRRTARAWAALKAASCARARGDHRGLVAASPDAAPRATTASPKSGCGTPITALSTTPGSSSSTSSISFG